MKRTIALAVVLILGGAAFASAQVIPGLKFELGTSVSYQSVKFDDDEGGAIGYLNIPIRFGWYLFKGLELEPEVQLFVPTGSEGGDTTYFLQAHLLYNFGIGGVAPFIGGGAGLGNGIPFLGAVEGGEDYKSFAYMGIAGIKLMVGRAAAIRLEYRFNRFSWETPWLLEGEKEWATLHNVLVGISVFF